MNNNSVRLSDSKIIKTVQNILKETLYPGPELLKTGMLFSRRVFGKDMLYCVG